MEAAAPRITAGRTFGYAPPTRAAIRLAKARCPGTTSPCSERVGIHSDQILPRFGPDSNSH
jgi:hypothetical protein